jgi:hypothetical protein
MYKPRQIDAHLQDQDLDLQCHYVVIYLQLMLTISFALKIYTYEATLFS